MIVKDKLTGKVIGRVGSLMPIREALDDLGILALADGILLDQDGKQIVGATLNTLETEAECVWVVRFRFWDVEPPAWHTFCELGSREEAKRQAAKLKEHLRKKDIVRVVAHGY